MAKPCWLYKHRHLFTKEAEEPAMSKNQTSVTRRALLKNAAAPAAAAFLLPQTGWDQQPAGMLPGSAPAVLHLPVLSQPDLVFAFVGDVEAGRYSLSRSGSSWTGSTRAAGTLGCGASFHSCDQSHLRFVTYDGIGGDLFYTSRQSIPCGIGISVGANVRLRTSTL